MDHFEEMPPEEMPPEERGESMEGQIELLPGLIAAKGVVIAIAMEEGLQMQLKDLPSSRGQQASERPAKLLAEALADRRASEIVKKVSEQLDRLIEEIDPRRLDNY